MVVLEALLLQLALLLQPKRIFFVLLLRLNVNDKAYTLGLWDTAGKKNLKI